MHRGQLKYRKRKQTVNLTFWEFGQLIFLEILIIFI